DTLIFNNDTLIGQGIYISNYDTDGNLIWLKSAGIANSIINSLKLNSDNAGNLYIIGNFGGGDPKTLTIGSVVLTSPSQTNIIFIAKYDSSGNPLWVKSITGSGGNTDTEVTNFFIDTYNNVYITGYFQSLSISFDSINLTNSGGSDIFIAKYNSSGNVLWAKSAGGSSIDFSNDIASDDVGNVYITGSFSSPDMIFGNDTLININTSDDFFLAKYNSSGNALWAKSAAGNGNDMGRSISIDAIGNAYITGGFKNPQITFDSITLTNTNLYSFKCFVVKYDSSGKALWAKSADGNIGNQGQNIITDVNGNIYITGTYNDDSIIFGNDTLLIIYAICDVMSGQLCSDIFLAKLSDTPTFVQPLFNEKPFNIFPNPSCDKIYIELPNDFPLSGTTTFTIYDINSRQLIKQPLYPVKTLVDINMLSPGVYILKISNEAKVIVKKLIKQ
ncbi:MAG: T9SS type A sorting domain-containing protein, partial [Bacteroidia bacterium]|nr:T9SS type A sorting domain-containing protein [Bacteroidia bacterium]